MTCTCGKPGRPRDVVDPVTHHIVARGTLCNRCFNAAIRTGARHRRRHDRRANGIRPMGRILMGVASALASLTALGCALAGCPLPGVACVVVGVWFAVRLWTDDAKETASMSKQPPTWNFDPTYMDTAKVNMYGFTPCPKCKEPFRCNFNNAPEVAVCDCCGFKEPVVRKPETTE